VTGSSGKRSLPTVCSERSSLFAKAVSGFGAVAADFGDRQTAPALPVIFAAGAARRQFNPG
jgi:hypothetical protein